MQNVGIAFMIILFNFPSPECDYAILPLISVATLTPLPLWIIYLIKSILTRIKAYKEKQDSSKDENYKDQNVEQTEKINLSAKLNSESAHLNEKVLKLQNKA
jgi:hypothetical protein